MNDAACAHGFSHCEQCCARPSEHWITRDGKKILVIAPPSGKSTGMMLTVLFQMMATHTHVLRT